MRMVVEKEASACEFDSHTPKTFLSNVMQLYLVADLEAQNLNYSQN